MVLSANGFIPPWQHAVVFGTANTSFLRAPQTPFTNLVNEAELFNHLTYQEWLPLQPYLTSPEDAGGSAGNFDSIDPDNVSLFQRAVDGTQHLDSLSDLSDAQVITSSLQQVGTALYQPPQPHPPSSQASSSNTSPASNSRIEKRKLNTLSARRYRQRRLDRMSELEAELRETRRERDQLKLRVAKLEGETEVLREMLHKDR